ncbi:hypothetical protein Cst_c15190 [Thermoclostridium stercorarium subsp. stercorarium DSM 8532]|uniref:Uncharacterized protein n=3 Tax=Thermoclostridium stercorarium TaxID=1510 RepID=L7VNZ8_THES1|nr:hypothetical protein [Thermoclostridium stercorarium]AGC68507.1 hypothetical protein Cst_c15190 [Thermoclostridium stercorarium subsp. stercorarium DSM 8532]AGI39524.1 hypothetical protein Clst_1466 [Thermoclostridium stercorarium subsp. stercorarium DSM 8532]ANW98865.1 hypothetical protein CSTERTH_07425 [Thermoclostridium stercorarium subsp. thermolacticum DSM 2910]ANX01390.1 hypothetical protein CSTERLE_07315 [Thermoclostridium stercorarium subsp. leptospartum DSM 9219]
MVLADKNCRKIIIECDCGCESIGIEKMEFENGVKEYFISISISSYYSEQSGFFNNLKNRVKTAWHILRHGTYTLHEICLNEKEFKYLKEIIQNYE